MKIARRNWFGHPAGLTVLCMTGMWEVFAIFGLRTTLIFYLIRELHFSSAQAVELYALSSAACVLMGVAGGLAADRLLGARNAVIAGALMMATASAVLPFRLLLYPGLGLMAVGNGLFKSTMVGQVGALYAPLDPRRDRAYLVYKFGCNAGAFLAPLICGAVGAAYGWKWAFPVAGVGMLVAAGIFRLGQTYLPMDVARAPSAKRAEPSGLPEHSGRLLLVVWIAAVCFWIVYRQVESTVALWADDRVNRTVAGWGHRFTVPAVWIQSLNPLLVFVLTPVINWRWARERSSGSIGRDLQKMRFGEVFLAAAFALLAIAAIGAGPTRLASSLWLVGAVGCLTLGELFFDPVGQALFGRAAVKGLRSLFSSLWFLASLAAYGVGAVLGGTWQRVGSPLFFAGMAGVALAGAALLFVSSRAAPTGHD